MRFTKRLIAGLLALALLNSPAFGAWTGPTLLGSLQNSSGAASKSITGVTAGAGSLIIFCGSAFTAATVANLSALDSGGNSWTFRGQKTSSNNTIAWVAWSVLVNPLSAGSITITSSANNLLDTFMGAASFTGQATGTVEDTSVRNAIGNQAVTNSPTITSGVPTASGDLMIGVMGEFWVAADTFTEDTTNGWTTIYHGVQGSADGHFSCAYQVNGGSGSKTYNPIVGSNSGNNFSLLTAGFLVGGGGPPPATNKLLLNRPIP